MNNEELLLNIFKQQQYDDTKFRMQKIVAIFSFLASLVAIVVMSIFYISMLHILVFVGAAVCISVGFLLYALKAISFNTASIIYIIYLCFVMVPGYWLLTNIYDSAPYIALIVLVDTIMITSGKVQKKLLFPYIAVLFGLTIYSFIIEIPNTSELPSLFYTGVAYVIAVILISLFMLSKLRKYEQMHDSFLRSSFRDDLTRLFSRKVMDIIFVYIEKTFISSNMDYIIVMMDVDKFKQMNDERGHVFGDIVLRSVAKCVEDRARYSDFVVRYGGDEFLVIQTNANDESVNAYMERIEETMANSCIPEIDVSISFGYAKRSECGSPEETLALADKRMYEHKESKK